MEQKNMGLALRCKDFFGYKEGQGLKGFQEEYKVLPSEDKKELCQLFNDAGMPTEMPVAKVV